MIITANLKSVLLNERARSFVFWCFVFAALDQALKWFVFAQVQPRILLSAGQTPLLGVEHFTNYRFAFSLPLPETFIYLIYGVALGAITWYAVKHFASWQPRTRLAWALIFAGAWSNVGERYLNGFVRDFLLVYGGGVLNLADLFILTGVVILLFSKTEPKNL